MSVEHTVLCEIRLGWADMCDCGADKYNKSLERQVNALTRKVVNTIPGLAKGENL